MKIKSVFEVLAWNFRKMFRYILNIDELFWKPTKEIDLDMLFNDDQNMPDFYFIQIGANDGLTGDSLRKYITKYNWKGVLVEPVPYVFKRLKENYKDYRGLHFENSAIGVKGGFTKFYALSEFDLQKKKLFGDHEKYKVDQLGSFDKATLLKHSYMHPQFESLVEEIDVPAMTFDSLLTKYNISNVDLLQLDVEGYDFELLNTMNFDKIVPKVLVFEHQHMKKEHYKAVLKKLRKIGYKFYVDSWDTVGVLKV